MSSVDNPKQAARSQNEKILGRDEKTNPSRLCPPNSVSSVLCSSQDVISREKGTENSLVRNQQTVKNKRTQWIEIHQSRRTNVTF